MLQCHDTQHTHDTHSNVLLIADQYTNSHRFTIQASLKVTNRSFYPVAQRLGNRTGKLAAGHATVELDGQCKNLQVIILQYTGWSKNGVYTQTQEQYDKVFVGQNDASTNAF